VGSFTLGAGQFCTKPGLVLLPEGEAGDRLVADMAARVRELDAAWMLNEGIAASYGRTTARLAETPGVQVAARGREATGEGFQAVPMLLTTAAGDLPEQVTEECFGPVAVLARYADESELLDALVTTPGSLTATTHRGEGETELPGRVARLFRERAGRFLYDGYPTGVAVSWAQHHGGPWPSTNTQYTSVGMTAIRRFLRPVTWQDAPAELLPEELRDPNADLPRRVDGVLRLPERTTSGSAS
jgi:NADP-dependent aldehyde dehydrogenase